MICIYLIVFGATFVTWLWPGQSLFNGSRGTITVLNTSHAYLVMSRTELRPYN